MLLLGVYLLRQPLVHPVLARVISALASSAGGMQVSVDEIDGDWFRTLGARGVRVSGGSGPLREAALEHAEVHFNLWTLLIRRDLSALSSVRVDGLHASIDLRDGRAATDAPA
ncbi:MAG: hypothetical protein ACI8QZ_004187, partial [Chlamydiales bacterium]